jgi:hypothetical protein
MTASTRILIPIDGSYKEYKKFEKIYKDTVYWKKIWFLVDTNLESKKLKTVNIIKLPEKNYDNYDFGDCFNSIGYKKNFAGFCEVDFAQNWSMYRSSIIHYETLKLKFIKIYKMVSENLEQTDLILNNATSHFFQRAVSFIAKSKGIHTISYTQSLVPGKEYVWVEGETFKVIFDDQKAQYQNLEDEFENITSNVISGKQNKTYLSIYGRTMYEQIKDIWLIRNRLQLKTFSINRLKYLNEKFITRKFRSLLWNRYAINKVPESEFFFFPLHMPGEAQTLIRGGQYPDDIELAINIAKIIPEGATLVVKEHPGYEGWKQLFDLRRLSVFPNIRLIKSTVSSHELIMKAKAVITINSSVWFESFAFEKRVFCFGDGAFSDHGVCDEISNVLELGSFLNTLEKSKYIVDEEMKEKRKKFVANYSNVSFNGSIYNYGDNELKSFAIFITQKLEKILNA